MNLRVSLLLSLLTLFLWYPSLSLAHDVPQHLDPELLTGWRTWLHLTIQWVHLVAFALWLGLTAGVLLLGMEPHLDHLLYGSWILFLVSLATGTYNMEWSAGISETPSLLSLPSLKGIPYGFAYTIVLGVKVGFYVLAALVALVITTLRLRQQVSEGQLRRVFLISESTIALLLALTASVVLFYHEVADLWPTPIHSMGGVSGPEGPQGRTVISGDFSLPNDFSLLATGAAWLDIAARWFHLMGFGLWLGGSAAALTFGRASPGRFLLVTWSALALQVASGVANMVRWTPFYVPPYVWNLSELSSIRFGRSYTLFMAAKHLLVVTAVLLLIVWNMRYLRNRGPNNLSVRPLATMSFLIALAIGYIMMIVLLLHEGVDHVL
ncbi:MAG: hypothetical protein HYT78_03290 [Deltaproteobacteria bacterium]|nr:hypothetical protein [Deltaproteobacteria bacterium]